MKLPRQSLTSLERDLARAEYARCLHQEADEGGPRARQPHVLKVTHERIRDKLHRIPINE